MTQKNKLGRLIAVIALLLALSASSANAQILIGADYGLEYASLNDYYHTRSGAQISASYFINPNVAFRLSLIAANKELVSQYYRTMSNWTAVSGLLSVNYYFLTSEVRPYVSLGVGQRNDRLSNTDISGYFNQNRLYIAPEFGLIYSVSPKAKINAGIRYSYLFNAKGAVMSFVGLSFPLTSQ